MPISFACLFALSSPNALADVGPLTLPDNRAWEQVSPADKQGNDVLHGGAVAALDGNRLSFKSLGAFAGAPASLTVSGGVNYIASRGGRWNTVPIMPQAGPLAGGKNGYQGFTADLSKGVLYRYESYETVGPVAPIVERGWMESDLYLHDMTSPADMEGGPFQLLNTLTRVPIFDAGFVWGSSDFGKIAISAWWATLTPDSPCFFSQTRLACAYEWDHGTMRLASVLEDDEPVTGTVGNDTFGSERDVGNVDHAVSDDGSRLFFTSPSDDVPERQLYVREDGTRTQLVSDSERTLPGGVSGKSANFQYAEAAHGDRVLFTTENTLVDADQDTTNDLYLADLTKPAGERLTLISADQNPEAPNGAAVNQGGFYGGIAGASEDLRRVYFVADNQIVAGAPEAPGPKLYLWEDTGAVPHLAYIGTLSSGDASAWRSPSTERKARVSADGRFLALLSAAKLTEFENEGQEEIYLYDAATGSLQCTSCSADAFPAEGTVDFNTPAPVIGGTDPVNHTLGNLSASGQVFFQTTRGLLPRDSNGKLDVYEYEDGGLHLISTGTGDSNSYFLDASPNGSDVFFTTRDRLVGWDRDELYDVYDARVGGGLPEPPPPTPPCEGDSCQPAPVVPVDPSLGSASFNGPGDAKSRKPRRCRAPKVRRHGRCRARHRAAHSQGKHTTRSHG